MTDRDTFVENELVPVMFRADSYTQPRIQMNAVGRLVIAYVGSFGGWYLTEEIFDFYESVKREYPSTFALMLTKQINVAKGLFDRGFGEEDVFMQTVAPGEVSYWLQGADIGISFVKPSYSKLSSSPTKIAEYLACGVPVISNRGIGDVDELLTKHKVGVLLDDFSEKSYTKAVREIFDLGDDRRDNSPEMSSVVDPHAPAA